MNTKELYELILSNINLFSEKLLEIKTKISPSQKKEVHLNDQKKDYLRIENGVKIVSISSNKDFILKTNFMFCATDNAIQSLIKDNIPIYRRDLCTPSEDFFCNIQYLQFVLEKYSFEIYRIETSSRSIPISLLESYINTIKPLIRSSDIYSFIYEDAGIKKYGPFAYKYIYKSIIWDFDSVEKFKDKLCWKHLIEDSNLKWDEDTLNKYSSYIPFCTKRKDNRYHSAFDEKYTISDFSNINFLSNHFIRQNYLNVNLSNFLRTAHFKWTGDDLLEFCKLFTSIDFKWGLFDSTAGEVFVPPYIIRELYLNKRFEWTPDLLKTVFNLFGSFNVFLSSTKGNIDMLSIFSNTFENYPILKEKIDIDFFICRFIEGHIPFDAYSIYFTSNNIIQNWNNWDIILTDKYVSTHRLSSDTSFGVYQVKTMWNYFNENKYVKLTYDICNIFKNSEITIGGEYEKEYRYQKNLDSGFITKRINALEYFGSHPITLEDLERVVNDSDLVHRLLHYKNQSLIDYILKQFFDKYSPKEFFETVDISNL